VWHARGEDAPAVLVVAERVHAAVHERLPGAGHQILHRARHQHLAGRGQRPERVGDLDGRTPEAVLLQVALAGVQADADGAAEARRRGGQRRRAANGAGGPVEGGGHARVAERDGAAAEPLDLAAGVGVELRVGAGAARQRLDARDEHRREHTIGVEVVIAPVEERLDLVEHRVLIADERQVVVARQFDEVCARDAARDEAPFLDLQTLIVGAMQHECRHAHGRQHVADVDLGVHARERQRGARARAHPQVGGPPLAECRVAGLRRRPRLDAHRAAPVLADFLEEVFAFGACRRPRVIRRPQPLGVGADHHERQRAIRVRGREEAAERSALRHAEQCRALRAHGFEHGAHVVHALLECREVRDAVRQTGAPFVEQDEP